MFRLADTMSDRHLVQVFTADGSQLIASVMTIPDYRLTPTDQTVIRFTEVPRGSPEVVRAWFYPGNIVGQEFVYPKRRAAELARAAKAAVPAVDTEVSDADVLRIAPIMAVTPDEQEAPVTAAIQATPRDTAGTVAAIPTEPRLQPGTTATRAAAAQDTGRLPETASPLALIAWFGLAAIALGSSLMVFNRYAAARAA
jgi:hypothetical protein